MIKDSGKRREFESGAVRDIEEGKGRCDLLPLCAVGMILNDTFLGDIERFKRTGESRYLKAAILESINILGFKTTESAMLEVSKHLEEGAKKYGENNWQKGIPVHTYIDSGVRHYLKYLDGYTDEPHGRAVIWNLLCAIWTCENIAELNDYGKEE